MGIIYIVILQHWFVFAQRVDYLALFLIFLEKKILETYIKGYYYNNVQCGKLLLISILRVVWQSW